MNINYKQPQFELFPANSATLEDINKPKFLLANLTLSLESLVILSILGIMVALFSFSLGVEHGKHLTAQAMDDRVAAAWNVGARRAAVVPAAVKPVMAAVPAAVVSVPRTLGNNGFVTSRNRIIIPVRNVAKPLPAPVIETSVVKGRLTLQAATYGNEEYARRDALELKGKGFQSFLIRSGKYWLLCVGQFNNKESAAALLKKLPAQYRSSQLRRF